MHFKLLFSISISVCMAFSSFLGASEDATHWCKSHDEGIQEFLSAMGDGECEDLFVGNSQIGEFGVYLRDNQVGKILDLSPITEMKELKSLSLYSKHTLKNVPAIYALKKLKRFAVHLQDWQGNLCQREEGFHDLETLDVRGPLKAIQDFAECVTNPDALKKLTLKIYDDQKQITLDFLSKYPNLENLEIECQSKANTGLDLAGLAATRNLEKLRISYCSNTGTLPKLVRLKELTWKYSNIRSIDFLSDVLEGAKHLEHFEVNSCPNLDDISAISKIEPNFGGRLSLAWNKNISDEHLVHLSHLTKVVRLDLNNTQIKGFGIRYLAPLVNVWRLDLDETFVDDEGLKNFEFWPAESQLKHLRLMITYSGNLTGKTAASLGHLTHLSELLMTHNQINNSGVRAIVESLPQLTELYLSSNPEIGEESLQYLGKHKGLKIINLAGTAIESDSEVFQQFEQEHAGLEISVSRSVKSIINNLIARGCSFDSENLDCNGKLSDKDFDLFLPLCSEDLVKSLHLKSSGLTGDGLQYLFHKGCFEWDSVRELTLAENPMRIFRGLEIFSNLETLNIDDVEGTDGGFLKDAKYGVFSKLKTLLARGTKISDDNALRLLELPSFEGFLLNEKFLKSSTIEKLEEKFVNLSKRAWDARRVAYETRHAIPCPDDVDEETVRDSVEVGIRLGLLDPDAAQKALLSNLLPWIVEKKADSFITGACIAPQRLHKDEL